jgi:acyl-CoA synthetase (AMP-forming)/AMP-acid ligase II
VTISLPARLWFDSPYAALVAAAAKWPRNAFLDVLPETARQYGIEARDYNYAAVLHEVNVLLAAYRAAGIRTGHRVGLMLENRPAFIFHWFALNALGASVVPLHTDWRGAELEYVIGHSELAMAIAPPSRHSDLMQAASAARRKIVVGTDASAIPQVPIDSMTGADGALSVPLDEASTECALLYTSGTTGRPKGCVLANEYFIWAGQWYASVGGLCDVRVGAERMLTPLPMSHMNAMACSTMCSLLCGGCLIALDRFHPSTWWQSVRDSRATIVHYLGVMPAMLLAAAESSEDRRHEVRFGFGAGVNPVHHVAFESRFGFPLLEAWAMTETGSGAVVIANREPRKVGTACFGAPEPAVEYRICDDAGVAVAPDAPGELLVRASGARARFGFFDRYLKDDASTAEAWAGGWFHTGDIVSADADGYLHFIDRKKNVIRRSGENIAAVEVEGALALCPGVQSVAVAGVPDELRGEEVLACVVPAENTAEIGRERLAQDIVAYALSRLAYFKAPGYIHFCHVLPRTATQKIQRGELRQLAALVLENHQVIDTRALKKRQNGA